MAPQREFGKMNSLAASAPRRPLPPTVGAIRAGVKDSSTQIEADRLASELIEEIKSADAVAIGIPRYNFQVPTTLKAYIDYIARPRITFQYGANGPEGLLPNDTPVYGFVASGGVYSNQPDSDFMSLWLKQVFGFVGLNNLELIHTEGAAMGGEQAQTAFSKTAQRIDEIVATL